MSWQFEDMLKAFNDFKNKQQKRTKKLFFDMYKYIYSESLFDTLYNAIKHKCSKKSFRQNKRYKNALFFFFRELQLIIVLLFICISYMSWSTTLISLKLCVAFSIFDSVLFLLKFIFLFNKKHGFFGFKTSLFISK